MRASLVSLSIALLTWFAGALGSAQEWTRFRGPNGSGQIETILPAEFSPSEFNWRVELPGIGHSSPVLWGERIFLLSADPDNATRYVLCLHAADGRTLWKRSYASAQHHLHARSSYASSTPAVDQDRVYVAWSTPAETTLMALTHDGKEVWRNDLGPWVSQHGFGTSPILDNDLVILSNSQQAEQLKPGQQPGKSQMMAFDRRTGQAAWSTPRKTVRVCYSVPCIYRPENGPAELICCSTAEGIFSLDPASGKPNWSTEGALSMRTVASPIIVAGLIFGSTGSGGGGNYLIAVRPGPKPEVVYEVRRKAPYVPTPVAREGLLFLWDDKGFVSCLDASSGKPHWKEQRVPGDYSGSPVRAGDKIYCINEDGVLVAIAAEKQFQLLGTTPLGEPSRATPAVAGGRMYLRTESHLISVGGKSS